MTRNKEGRHREFGTHGTYGWKKKNCGRRRAIYTTSLREWMSERKCCGESWSPTLLRDTARKRWSHDSSLFYSNVTKLLPTREIYFFFLKYVMASHLHVKLWRVIYKFDKIASEQRVCVSAIEQQWIHWPWVPSLRKRVRSFTALVSLHYANLWELISYHNN